MISNKFVKIVLAFTLVSVSSNGFSAALEEVVVTAQKRSQSVQDVPVAVTALSGDAMREAGVLNTKDLTDVNPSISFEVGQSSQNASLKIRGIGSVGNGRTFEGAVGVFIDGVYRSRSGMALQDMNDIGRLELLRGPQGTLFGKNTVAGALSLESNSPSFDGVNGVVEVMSGNYDRQFISGAINIPVDERNALRFSGIFNKQDGFLKSPQQNTTYNDTDRYGLKAQWLFDFSENITSHLIADYSKSDSKCCWGSVQVVTGPTGDGIEYFAGTRGLDLYGADDDAEDKRLTNNNQQSTAIMEDMGLTWKVDWSFNDFDLKSITGLRRFNEQQIDGDADFSPAHIVTIDEDATIDFFSQEFNFSWAWDRTDIVAGLYYSFEDFESERILGADTDADSYITYLLFGQVQADLASPLCQLIGALTGSCVSTGLAPEGGSPITIEGYQQNATSAAAYFHSQTELNDYWTIVAGLRYSYDKKTGGYDNIYWYNSPLAQTIVATGATGQPPSGDANTPRNGFDVAGLYWGPSFQDDFSSSVVTGNLSVQYRFNDDVMAYLSYGKGYKSGAVNLFFEADNFDNTTYEPEYAKSIEFGIKSRYFDNSAQTNIALFRSEFTDLQINFFTGLNFFTVNTGEAVSQGLEIENQYQINENYRAEINITLLDSKFGDLSDSPESIRHLDGRDTPRAPTLGAVSAIYYEKPISSSVEVIARLSASYTGDHYVGVDGGPSEPKQDAYTLWDAALGLRYLSDQEWEVKLFCKNCTNETYRSIYFPTPLQSGSYNAYLNDPRQIGLSIQSQF